MLSWQGLVHNWSKEEAESVRRRSYRYSNLSESEAPRAALELFPLVQSLWMDLDSGQIHPAILCSRVLMGFNQFRFGHKWKGGGAPSNTEQGFSAEQISMLPSELLIWTKSTIRGIPWSVNRSLILWWLNQYHLRLYSHVPTAAQVLAQQCQGFRCVTFFRTQAELSELVEGERDAFSFLIHDLIHADHFFSDHELSHQQIHFYHQINGKLADRELLEMFESDPSFAKELNYIVADMNSHPAHLRLSWKAAILNAFKRRHGVSLRQRLDDKLEIEFNEWREQFMIS